MRSSVLILACMSAAVAAPALAQQSDAMKPAGTMAAGDAMKPAGEMSAGDGMMKMMKGGEVVAIMPDGHMGTMMMTDDKMSGQMMKMAQPMKGCMMFMTGADGKAMMVDTSSAMAMAECEKIAK